MLRDLQLGFMKIVVAGGAAPEVVAAVAGDERLDAAGRLQIYADMVRERLRAALESMFPALARVLGAEAFAELSERYVAAHPSRHPSLRWLGRELPGFLSGWLADLAALEWARHDVFDARDEEILDGAAIARFGPERIAELPLRLIEAHRLVRVAHAVETVWREEHREPAAEPGVLLVWRDGVSVFHRRVDDLAAAALAAAARGLPFGALCELVAGTVPEEDAPRVAGELLGGFLADRLLAA